MTLTLVKTNSVECTKCKAHDFRLINGAKVCMGCNTYTYKELRDTTKARK